MSDEVRLCVNGQWFYRGNVSPSWFFLHSHHAGIAEKVTTGILWQLLDEIARLKECLKEREELALQLNGAKLDADKLMLSLNGARLDALCWKTQSEQFEARTIELAQKLAQATEMIDWQVSAIQKLRDQLQRPGADCSPSPGPNHST